VCGLNLVVATLMNGSSLFPVGADMFLKNSAAIRRLPDLVIRSLPPMSAIYSSQISCARCLPAMTAGGWSIEHRPTASSEANSSRVITLGSEAMIQDLSVLSLMLA
jgi:hypothetical protein